MSSVQVKSEQISIKKKDTWDFIHESERREEPRLGEVVEGRVVRVKDNGEFNMSLIPQKEFAD